MLNQETLKQAIADSGYEDVVLFENPDYADACIGISSTIELYTAIRRW